MQSCHPSSYCSSSSSGIGLDQQVISLRGQKVTNLKPCLRSPLYDTLVEASSPGSIYQYEDSSQCNGDTMYRLIPDNNLNQPSQLQCNPYCVHSSTSHELHRHSPTSHELHRHSPTSQDQQRHSPTSHELHRHSPTSQDQQRHSPTSHELHRHSPTSQDQQRHSPTSQDQQRHSPTSQDQQRHSPTSQEQQRYSPTSQDQQRHSPTYHGPHRSPPTSHDLRKHSPISHDHLNSSFSCNQHNSPSPPLYQLNRNTPTSHHASPSHVDHGFPGCTVAWSGRVPACLCQCLECKSQMSVRRYKKVTFADSTVSTNSLSNNKPVNDPLHSDLNNKRVCHCIDFTSILKSTNYFFT